MIFKSLSEAEVENIFSGVLMERSTQFFLVACVDQKTCFVKCHGKIITHAFKARHHWQCHLLMQHALKGRLKGADVPPNNQLHHQTCSFYSGEQNL